MAAIGIYVLFNINTAMAEHNGNDKAHPQSMAAVVAVESTVELMAQRIDSNQVLNKAAQVATKDSLSRLEKSNEKLIDLIVSMNSRL